jgi:hypothetical protein
VTRSPDLAEGAASLLDAVPGLVRVLGLRDASAVGHRRILPVLTVPAGAWAPPPRDELGAGTVALTVLGGWLTDGVVLVGPRDTFDAWSRPWTVCADARLAVIGDVFSGALRTWPRAALRLPGAAHARVPEDHRPLEERVLELLWRIALRWGRSTAGGVELPPSVDRRALGLILDVGAVAVGLALVRLEARGVECRAGGLHLLPAGELRRDTLRAAATRQLALARAAHDDCLALCELLDAGLRGRAARIPTQKTSTRPDRVRSSQVRASTGGAAGGRIPTENGRSAPGT